MLQWLLRSLTDHVREALGPKGYRVRYPEEIIRELFHKISQIVKCFERIRREPVNSGSIVASTLNSV